MRRTSLCLTVALFGASFSVAHADGIELPDGPNRDVVYGTCRTCHDLQYLEESAGIPGDAWNDILTSMKGYGLRIDDDKRKKILDYLSTYLGPNPPPAKPVAVTKAEATADGPTLFTNNCSSCHQMNGQGVKGQFPPLAGNTDLFLERTFPAFVVTHGLNGTIVVHDVKYDGQMPSFSYLSDADIAAVINYVRSSWGNDKNRPAGMKDLEASDIAAARAKDMSPGDVHVYRASLAK